MSDRVKEDNRHTLFPQDKVPAMQSSEGGSDYISGSGIQIRMSTSAQPPMVQHQQYQQYPGYQTMVFPYVEGGEAMFNNPALFNPNVHQLYSFAPQAAVPQVTAVSSEMANVENSQSSSCGFAPQHKRNPHLKWLKDNLEMAGEGSLSRCSLYHDYLRHCQEQKLEPVNQPSLGKLIRTVFADLKTRRLGTRGNSKYHYYGMRVKPNSPLAKLKEDPQYTAKEDPQYTAKEDPQYPATGEQPVHSVVDRPGVSRQHTSDNTSALEQLEAARSQQQPLQRFPALELDLDGQPLPGGRLGKSDVKRLQTLYRQNCAAVLDAVTSLQFHRVEELWRSFWCSTAPPSGDRATALVPSDNAAPEGTIPRDNLVALCEYENVRVWMRNCDSILYQAVVEVLVPNVLCQDPSDLAQHVRNFAKSAEGWMAAATRDFPQKEVVCDKAKAVIALAQTLRHYTQLNHLAREARPHLRKASAVNAMLVDLNNVNFADIHRQASWVCQCDESVVRRLEESLKATLRGSGDRWATWLDDVVSQFLKFPHQEKERCVEDARQFLFRWSIYSSMVIRDLTLRSAASLGPCHLMRLFYDEYLLYLVARRLAKATRQTVVAVVGELST